MKQKQKIVIVGGGFAGLTLLQNLDKKIYDVTVVDKNNFHGFPPLFYQIASCGIDSGSISFPFRRELRKGRAHGGSFRLGEVRNIDTNNKVVYTQHEPIPYDKLIIAAGSTNNFFGTPDLIKSVYTLKSASEALRIRDAVLQRLELASLEKDDEKKRRLLSFTVIGGGATGVEIAGALGEMRHYIIPREYTAIEPSQVTVTLVEGTNAVLSAMSVESQQKALGCLEKLGVKVMLNHLLKNYDGEDVILENGEKIPSGMVIWTAGVKAQRLDFTNGSPEIGHGGRFVVDEFNAVNGIDDVYAVGDICIMECEDYPHGHPQLAQVAIQQSRNLAYNFNMAWKLPKLFRYKDKGTMATIGRNMAVADLKHFKLSGRLAWLAWMFVHLISILGMRNKLTVLINWIWSYCTYSTSLRQLIYHSKYPLYHPKSHDDELMK